MKKVRLHTSFWAWKSWGRGNDGRPWETPTGAWLFAGCSDGAEECLGWAQVAMLAFLISPCRIGYIAGLRTKRGMSWVSQQGALCGAGGNLVFVSGMLAQGQISTFISMTHNVLLIKHLCPS